MLGKQYRLQTFMKKEEKIIYNYIVK